MDEKARCDKRHSGLFYLRITQSRAQFPPLFPPFFVPDRLIQLRIGDGILCLLKLLLYLHRHRKHSGRLCFMRPVRQNTAALGMLSGILILPQLKKQRRRLPVAQFIACFRFFAQCLPIPLLQIAVLNTLYYLLVIGIQDFPVILIRKAVSMPEMAVFVNSFGALVKSSSLRT